MSKNNLQNFNKVLVFPNTETYQELFTIQQIEFEKKNDSLIIRLDVNQWINLKMILKLKLFTDHNQPKGFQKINLFSRPLIKEILRELIENLLNLKRQEFYLIDKNLEDVWVNFSIKNNMFRLNKAIILSKMIKSPHLQGNGDDMINKLIQPILNLYENEEFQLGLHEKIRQIISQRPFSDYKKQCKIHHLNTQLNTFKQTYLSNKDQIMIDDEVLKQSYIYEFYYYQVPTNENLREQLLSKYQLIQLEINHYLKSFQSIFESIDYQKIDYIKKLITKVIKEKIQLRGYSNSVNNFMEMDFKISTFVEKQEIFYIFFQVIQQLENKVQSFGLLLTLHKILIDLQNNIYQTHESQLQLQQYYQQNLKEIRDKIQKQIRKFYHQIKDHLQLNEDIKDKIFQHLDIEYIIGTVCEQLKSSWAEWDENKDLLIKKAIISQQQIIKEAFFKSISTYVQTL